VVRCDAVSGARSRELGHGVRSAANVVVTGRHDVAHEPVFLPLGEARCLPSRRMAAEPAPSNTVWSARSAQYGASGHSAEAGEIIYPCLNSCVCRLCSTAAWAHLNGPEWLVGGPCGLGRLRVPERSATDFGVPSPYGVSGVGAVPARFPEADVIIPVEE